MNIQKENIGEQHASVRTYYVAFMDNIMQKFALKVTYKNVLALQQQKKTLKSFLI